MSRPIPTSQLCGLESQLRQHYREEKRKREHRRDLLRADPYQNSPHGNVSGRGQSSSSNFGGMADSAVLMNSPDMFYSLNLHDSFSEASTRSEFGGDRSMESSVCTAAASSTGMGDSYVSTASTQNRRGRSPESVCSGGLYDDTEDAVSLDSIPLGGGSGLQQLARGSSARRNRASGGERDTRTGAGGGGRREGVTQHDVCKYSLTLSGVTVAVLEADPAYTHTTDTPSTNTHRARTNSSKRGHTSSSLDSSGLDPACYLLEVAEVLKCGGVNRREIQRQQEHLAQALPLDHLL